MGAEKTNAQPPPPAPQDWEGTRVPTKGAGLLLPAEPLVGAPPWPGDPLNPGTPSPNLPESRGGQRELEPCGFRSPQPLFVVTSARSCTVAPRRPPSPSPLRLPWLMAQAWDQAWDQAAWLGLGASRTAAQASTPVTGNTQAQRLPPAAS